MAISGDFLILHLVFSCEAQPSGQEGGEGRGGGEEGEGDEDSVHPSGQRAGG